jgi:hypothetical protein
MEITRDSFLDKKSPYHYRVLGLVITKGERWGLQAFFWRRFYFIQFGKKKGGD